MRHRRRGGNRTPQKTAWQSFTWFPNTVQVTKTERVEVVATHFIPGVVAGAVDSAIRPFDQPVTLERVRGHIVHVGSEVGGSATILPVNFAACVIPAEFANNLSTTLPNLFQNLEGDDYFLYQSCVCGEFTTNNVTPIDGKARRRLEVGDALVFLLEVAHPNNAQTTGTVQVEFGANLRILWRTN